jgi:DNA polymerase III delta prime subunit
VDAERLTVNLAGKEALYKLSGGDMRKAINIMQVGAWLEDFANMGLYCIATTSISEHVDGTCEGG